MLKRKMLCGALLLAQTAFGSARGPEEDRCVTSAQVKGADVHERWLSPHLTSDQKVLLLRMLHARQSVICDVYEIKGGLRTPGRFYGDLTPFTVEGLIHVRDLVASRQLPKVLDVGAGDGYHAGLFALAGSHVTLLENDPCLVDLKTQKNLPGRILVTLLRDFLPEGVCTKDRTRIIAQDAVETLHLKSHEAQYDLINAANVLHAMTPTQAKACVEGMFKAVKPGGLVYARVQTISLSCPMAQKEAFDAYCRALKKESPFPGWLALMGAHTPSGEEKRVVTLKMESTFSPMEAHLSIVKTPDCDVPMTMQPTFAFDVATLKRLFEGAGFTTTSCRFEMGGGDLMPTQEGQETFVGAPHHPLISTFKPSLRMSYGATNICYVARKPQ